MGPRASVGPRAPWMLDIISNPIHLVQMGKLRPREGKDVLEAKIQAWHFQDRTWGWRTKPCVLSGPHFSVLLPRFPHFSKRNLRL